MNDTSEEQKNAELSSEELAEMLNVAESTLRKYALQLEKVGYSFKKDVSKKRHSRVFTEKDFETFTRFIEYKEAGFSLEKAAYLAANVEAKDADKSELTLASAFEHRNEAALLRNEKVMSEAMSTITSLQKQIHDKEEESKQHQRAAALDAQITLRRVEMRLRAEAKQKWQEKDESERFKRVLFRKIERTEEKKEFIEHYIHEHLETELEKEKN